MRRVGTWTLLAWAALTLPGGARAGGPAPRGLPANATQPEGASFERQIAPEQRAAFVRGVLRDSAREFFERPFATVFKNVGRSAERVRVRLAEAVPFDAPGPGRGDPEAGGPLTPARVTPLFGSGPAYEALLGLVRSATVRIDLMMYSWDDDSAGRAVADALVARASAGVAVRVVVDRGSFVSGSGNAHAVRGCPTFLDALRATPNVRLIEAPDPFLRFDHRKVAVVDDRVVWTGGMIFTAPALARWHNFAFLAEGPVVAQYAALFDDRWESLGGCRTSRRPPTGEVAPNACVRVVRTDDRVRTLKEAVYGAVDSAGHHVYVENCYFSDQILVKKLVSARARGVDVRAVLTLRGDVRLLNEFSGLVANRLLRGGARVYLYPAMTHVKALSVDGKLAYLGTGNFDELSLRNNREVGLTVRGPSLVADIERDLFLRDMAASEELHAPLPPPPRPLLLGLFSLWY